MTEYIQHGVHQIHDLKSSPLLHSFNHLSPDFINSIANTKLINLHSPINCQKFQEENGSHVMHLIPGIHDINTEFLTSVLVVHLSVQFKKKTFLTP